MALKPVLLVYQTKSVLVWSERRETLFGQGEGKVSLNVLSELSLLSLPGSRFQHPGYRCLSEFWNTRAKFFSTSFLGPCLWLPGQALPGFEVNSLAINLSSRCEEGAVFHRSHCRQPGLPTSPSSFISSFAGLIKLPYSLLGERRLTIRPKSCWFQLLHFHTSDSLENQGRPQPDNKVVLVFLVLLYQASRPVMHSSVWLPSRAILGGEVNLKVSQEPQLSFRHSEVLATKWVLLSLQGCCRMLPGNLSMPFPLQ